MMDVLLKMKEVRDKAVFKGRESLSYYYTHGFQKFYMSIIERLFDHEGAICLFTKNFHVPFENNQAERDIRMVKVKTKVSGCFRTKDGDQDFLTIMSYIGTAKKQGKSPLLSIRNALLGKGEFIFT